MSAPPADFFTEELAKRYDERNRRLAPIGDSLHFLMRLVLEDSPTHSRVLSVGAGTGADILALAEAFPHWSFVAADPSLSMLNVCRERMQNAGLSDRCEFVHGFAHDVPEREFDIAIALLVGHFVKHENRPSFYRDVVDRVRVGGCFLNAEISFDLSSEPYPFMIRNWQAVQKLMGATDESLKAVPQQLREVLTVLAPDEVDALLVASGIGTPVRFFQAFMISGWYGTRTRA